MIWHRSFNSPASKTVNKPTGPAPMMIISVSTISVTKIMIQNKMICDKRYGRLFFRNLQSKFRQTVRSFPDFDNIAFFVFA